MTSILDLSYGNIDDIDSQVIPESADRAIERMNLSNNRIARFAKNIDPFKNITVLDLSGNKMTSITGISKLLDLQVLSLANNLLTTESIELEPLNLLPNLQKLNLNGNKLKKVPLTVCDIKQLTHLGLAENAISHLPAQMTSMAYLCFLSVRDNDIRTSNIGKKLLSLDFAELPLIRGLAISGNPIVEILGEGRLAQIPLVQLVESRLNITNANPRKSSFMGLTRPSVKIGKTVTKKNLSSASHVTPIDNPIAE